MKNPFDHVRDFEAAVSQYTGAPYVVAVNSCTMALLLAVAWHTMRDGITPPMGERMRISIPKKTYISVPMSIIHAGAIPTFIGREWIGYYQLAPLPVWDSARFFSSGMFKANEKNTFMCVSFHASKTLGDTQGGAILHNCEEADGWLRRARFDGRTEGLHPSKDDFNMIGWHCYMSPDVATRLLWKLRTLPLHNEPLPNDDYPDLSKMKIFKLGDDDE